MLVVTAPKHDIEQNKREQKVEKAINIMMQN